MFRVWSSIFTIIVLALFGWDRVLASGTPTPTSALPRWERHAFPLPQSIWSVEAIDVDGDGQRDLIAMGESKVFVLSGPEWKERVLFDALETKLLYCVAIDVNRDVRVDLALARYRNPWAEFRQARASGHEIPAPVGPDFSVAWIENVGGAEQTWPLHIIEREFNGVHGLCVGDVDADGRPDLLADSISGPDFPRSLAWFQTGDAGKGFGPRQLVTNGGAGTRPHYLDFADLDGDGRGDLLVGDSGGGSFTWWNRGVLPGESSTRHVIAEEKGATNIRAVDINGDGRPDVVGTCGHGQGFFWFSAPDWEKHGIDSGLVTPHALGVGDFDGDGKVDLAVNSYTTGVVRWYQNRGDGTFTAREIDTGNQQQAYDLKTVDLDGDGRLDLIMAGRESRNAVWYRNGK